jgi:two-component system sensor histidine kinase VicK
MRWWLALAFATVAGVTALAVVPVLTRGSEHAFRSRAQELAAGRAFQAAIDVTTAEREARPLGGALTPIAARHRLALFVFDGEGTLVSPRTARGVQLDAIENWRDAVASALQGRRYVATVQTNKASIVAVPLGNRRQAALVAYAGDSDVASELGIVRQQVLEAALVALAVGGLAGFIIAVLIAARLRRVAATAAAIEGGSFDTHLEPRFRDEVGQLAETIDRMRRRLRTSFAQLESERLRLERLLARLHQGVVTIDKGLRVEYANEAARRLLDTEALAEGDPLPAMSYGVRIRDFAEALFHDDATVSEVRVAAGTDRTYSLVGVPVRDAEGAILVVTDVTLQERRERAEREFVQNAAHELRTPLTTIRAAIEALEAGYKDVPAERDRFLAHIDRESDRLTRLIHALLVLARAQTQEESPQLHAVGVRSLLEDVVTVLEPSEGVEVRVDCDPELFVVTNRDLAWEAVANLAVNAVKSTREGHVSLSATNGSNGHVTVRVTDTGEGINQDVVERVFDRFFRTGRREGDGFGLGLAIVRDAVDAVGADVRIESQPGVGTTATVVFPRGEVPR